MALRLTILRTPWFGGFHMVMASLAGALSLGTGDYAAGVSLFGPDKIDAFSACASVGGLQRPHEDDAVASSLDCSDTGHPLLQCFGFFVPFRGSIQRRQILKVCGHIGMVRPQRLLAYRQHSLSNQPDEDGVAL